MSTKENNMGKCIGYSIAILAFLLLPLFLDPYNLGILIVGLVSGICASGVRQMFVMGQVNVGQAAFMGIGAYASTLITMRLGISFWFALPIVGLLSGVIGALVGWPILRVKGVYFAILSLCFAEALLALIRSWPGGPFGGAGGIANVPRPELFGIDFLTSKVSYYYIVLALSLLSIWVLSRIDGSRIGRLNRAIGQSDILVESIGANVTKYKVIAMGVSSLFAGLAGSFYAHYYSYVAPEMFGAFESIFFLIYAVAGGLGSVIGPFIGAVILVGAAETFRITKLLQPIVFAVFMLLVIYLLPRGLISLPGLVMEVVVRYRKKWNVPLRKSEDVVLVEDDPTDNGG